MSTEHAELKLTLAQYWVSLCHVFKFPFIYIYCIMYIYVCIYIYMFFCNLFFGCSKSMLFGKVSHQIVVHSLPEIARPSGQE